MSKHSRQQFNSKRHQTAVPSRDKSKGMTTRRRGSLCLRETPDYLELTGAPEVNQYNRYFCAIWIAIWTFGCVYFTIAFFEPMGDVPMFTRLILLGILWSAWLLMVPFLLLMNGRVETLRIDSECVQHRTSLRLFFLVMPIQNRRVPLKDLGLSERYNVNNNGYWETGIQIPTSGKPIRCFTTQTGDTPRAFINALNERLQQYGVTGKSRLQQKPQETPLDSRWSLRDDGMTQTFTRRGRVTTWAFWSTIFGCVFVNGIISVVAGFFVDGWLKGEVSLVVLIILSVPFAGVTVFMGLPMLLMTFLVLLQLLCRYTITLDDHCVRYRRSWLGIGRQRIWMLTDIDTVSVKRKKSKLRWFEMFRNPELANSGDGVTNPYPFFVQFLSKANKPPCIIPNLLEGEARRIVSLIRQKM